MVFVSEVADVEQEVEEDLAEQPGYELESTSTGFRDRNQCQSGRVSVL